MPYVLTADNRTPAGAEFGRCERINSCGYIRYPHGVTRVAVAVPDCVPEKPLRMKQSVLAVTAGYTNLFGYVSRLVGAEAAERVWRDYHIGGWGDMTVFWQIDRHGEVRGGKAIPYGGDGHRLKNDDRSHAVWLHKVKDFDGFRDGDRLEQCFFGEHLLTGNDKPVAIVESEKTALVMAAVVPDRVWLASGGSQGINDRKAEALSDRCKVKLYPDNRMYWKWLGWGQRFGWTCSPKCEEVMPDLPDGYDILDIFEKKQKS